MDDRLKTLANRTMRLSTERSWLLYWCLRTYRETGQDAIRWGIWRTLTAIDLDPDSAEADAILARGEPRIDGDKHHGNEAANDDEIDANDDETDD